MKKLFMFLAVAGLLTFTAFQTVNAQEKEATEQAAPDSTVAAVDNAQPASPEQVVEQPKTEGALQRLHQQLKAKFIEGGPFFMSLVLLCLILGMAIVIERIITLNLAKANSKKILAGVEKALQDGDVERAKDICRNTRGPVASIIYQGLIRMDQGVENVEKAVTSYGSVQMGQLEKGLSWISLFIGVAPMLGFLGTVLGLIEAFDAIEVAGDISPNLVAGGMKVALITTVGGLIVAIILQFFYNYLVTKIDSIVNDMEDASVSFVDLMVKYQK